jgi:hypothetical protein
MNKVFLSIIALFFLSILLFAPFLTKTVSAAGLVTCDGTIADKCDETKVMSMLTGILQFIINDIAIPLATVAIIIGAIILTTSGGNPGMAGTGRKILIAAIIGLLLALCSKLIINFILNAIGASSYQI